MTTLPTPGTARSAIAAHLARAFALVDTPPRAWARAFLLDDNPAVTLAVLTNGEAAPFSVTSTSVDTAFETVPPADGREAFDSRFAFDALLVPSFSSAGLGVGVVVNRIVAVAAGGVPAPGSDAKARCRFAAQVARGGTPRLPPTTGGGGVGDADYKYSLGKYVRDERNGTLLIVKHTGVGSGGPGTGGTQVMYLEHLSTTRRYRMYFHCETAQFKACKFVDSVLACVTNTEARHCPVCREGPGANCDCRLELEPPKGPFDFRGAAKAMASQTGDYLGQAGITISLRDKRAEVTAGVVRPRRYVSAPLISSLRTASFSGSRCDSTHDTLAAILQNFAVQTSLSEASVGRGLAGGQPPLPVLLPPTSVPVPSVEHYVEGFGTAAGPGAQGHEESGFREEVASVNPPAPDQVTDLASALLADGAEACDVAMGLQPPPTDMIDSYLLLDQDDGLEDPKLFENLGELNGDSLTGALEEMTAAEESRSRSENVSSSPQASVQCGKTSVRAKDCTDEELAARELRRRTKNRESAARANARKKAMNDELKANIRDAQARAATLQARQTELLKENIGLRREVGIIHLKKVGASAGRAAEDAKKADDELRASVVKMEDTSPVSSAKLVEAAVAAVAASRSSAGASVDAL